MRDKILGASWAPSLIGYALGILAEVKVYVDNQGVPTDFNGWLIAAMGILVAIGGRITKQSNVTNASTPIPARPIVEVEVAREAPTVTKMVDK